MLDTGSHLTQLCLITADTPWVGALYTRLYVPAMTGLTESQDDSNIRNHMTPNRMAVMDASAQPIHRLEAQAMARTLLIALTTRRSCSRLGMASI